MPAALCTPGVATTVNNNAHTPRPLTHRQRRNHWKPNTEVNNSDDEARTSYSFSEMSAKVRVRLAFSPRGGSWVNLMPFCRMGTGNLGDGMDVSHNRESRCCSFLLAACSSSCSSRGNHDTARWQFCTARYAKPNILIRIWGNNNFTHSNTLGTHADPVPRLSTMHNHKTCRQARRLSPCTATAGFRF